MFHVSGVNISGAKVSGANVSGENVSLYQNTYIGSKYD